MIFPLENNWCGLCYNHNFIINLYDLYYNHNRSIMIHNILKDSDLIFLF